jgi:cytidine deaminase
MDEIKITSKFIVFSNSDELSLSDKELFLKAKSARKNAYAPYSKFNVGAALLLENGDIILGSNQENAAYPSGMCAERVAIWNASSQFPNVPIKKIFISANVNNK